MTTALDTVRNDCGMAGEEVADMVDDLTKENTLLRKQLAESQAREAQLRDALKEIKMVAESAVKTHGYDKYHVRNRQVVIDALALPHDDTALREWGARLLRESVKVTSTFSAGGLKP